MTSSDSDLDEVEGFRLVPALIGVFIAAVVCAWVTFR